MTLVEQIAEVMAQRRVQHHVDLIDSGKIIRATIHKVTKVKTDNGAPGKAQLTFLATNSEDGELEQIETDWLSDPVAVHIATVAKAAIGGQPVTLWKHNAPDPTGKVSQGYRRIVWIEA